LSEPRFGGIKGFLGNKRSLIKMMRLLPLILFLVYPKNPLIPPNPGSDILLIPPNRGSDILIARARFLPAAPLSYS